MTVTMALFTTMMALPALSSAFIPSAGLGRPHRALSKLHVGEGSTWIREVKPLEPTDYIAVGLAKCFVTEPDSKKLKEVYVVEPLTAGTLETLAFGVPTSYKRVIALTCGDLLQGDVTDPTGLKLEALAPMLKGETPMECEDMLTRTLAAARTFRRRVEAQIIPVGQVADEFNFNTDKKRILDLVYEPSFDDNVKQDKSIDAYGREFDDEVAALANA